MATERLERILQELKEENQAEAAAAAEAESKTAVEGPPRDRPICPGGPLESQVASWKRQFKEVYATGFGDEVYVWRPLTRYEYKMLLAQPNQDPLMREEAIAQTCVLWPTNFNYEAQAPGKAGTVSVLAEQIMEASNFTRKVIPKRL